jgi:glycerol-3-phosphate dehydrogenase subunit B
VCSLANFAQQFTTTSLPTSLFARSKRAEYRAKAGAMLPLVPVQNTEIIVLGGGIAGVSAALAAAASGARVTLVRSGPGVTALASGAWNDPPPSQLREILADVGFSLTDCDDALPHPSGHLITCACADASHARASIAAATPGDAPDDTMIAGFAGLPGFRPAALAALWGVPRTAETVLLDGTPAAGWSLAALAATVEREPGAIGRQLQRLARGVRRIIVPAVLGLKRSCYREVSDAAGLEVAEALGGAPSLPGWRLDAALLRALAARDIRVVTGTVTARDASGSRMRSVIVNGAPFAAAGFVLATGKYAGGGIDGDEKFAETALRCDVVIQRFGRSFDDAAESLSLTDPVRTEAQPLLGAGVVTDVRARPLAPGGDVRFTNVFVAGSVRAGVETASLGLGAAATDGWNAGLLAAGAGS